MMKLKELVLNKFNKKKKKEEEEKEYNPDPAIVCIGDGIYIPLSETSDQLSTANHIQAKGTWRNEDFILLRNLLKNSISSLAANVVLQKVDLGEVSLSRHSPSIEMKDLCKFCVNLTDLILPDASRYEGRVNFDAAFCGCSKLKRIEHFGTYKNISGLAGTFCYCSLLASIEILSDPLPKGDTETFHNTNREIALTVPADAEIPSTWSQINPQTIIRHTVPGPP